MCDILESAGFCSNETTYTFYDYADDEFDEFITPAWPQGICVSNSSNTQSFSCECPPDSWLTGRSDIINFDGYLCHNPRIIEQVIWALASLGALRMIFYGFVAWKHQFTQLLRRDAVRAVQSRRGGIPSGLSQTTTRQQVGWLSWLSCSCCVRRRRQRAQTSKDNKGLFPSDDNVYGHPYSGTNKGGPQESKTVRIIKLCYGHAPLRYVTASVGGFACIVIASGMKALTDQLICVDLLLTVLFASGWAMTLMASVPVNNNLYAMMAKGDMVADNIERVHKFIQRYQFITFVATAAYAILTIIILIGGCIITSPKVYGERFAGRAPRDNPARFILYLFNAVVVFVCVVYMTQLSHAMRVTRSFQRSVTSNLMYGHDNEKSTESVSEESSSGEGINSEGIVSGQNVYSTDNSSERGTASSPPQFKSAINLVYRLFAINLLKVGLVGVCQLAFCVPALWPYQSFALGLATVSLSTDLKSNVVGIYLPKRKSSSTMGSTRTAGNGNTNLADSPEADSYQMAGAFSQSFGGDVPLQPVAEEDEMPSQSQPQNREGRYYSI